MIELLPDSLAGDSSAPFRTSVQRECPDVRFAWIGGNLLVVGTVRAYSMKAFIETQAAEAGLSIQNCVRVVPGREQLAPRTVPLAG
jgi:hypothetical protein